MAHSLQLYSKPTTAVICEKNFAKFTSYTTAIIANNYLLLENNRLYPAVATHCLEAIPRALTHISISEHAKLANI